MAFEKNEYETSGFTPSISDFQNTIQNSSDESGFGRTTVELQFLNLLRVEKEIELFRRGKEHLEKKEFHEAINLFRKLIEINDKEAAYHSYLGIALLKKGWDSYAQEEFRKALYCDPNNIIALIYYKDSKCTTQLNPKITANLAIRQETVQELPKKKFFKKISDFVNWIKTSSVTEY